MRQRSIGLAHDEYLQVAKSLATHNLHALTATRGQYATGPNGAGKTALLRAMTATVDFVVHSIGLDSSDPIPNFLPFLSPSARTGPTRIEADFDTGWFSSEPGQPDLRCRYTLELRREDSDLHPLRVSYEALHAFPRNRPRRILERREHGPVYVARELKIRRSDSRLVSVPANASVISTFAKFDMEPFSSMAADFMAVQRNIAGPDSLRPSTDVVTRFYRDNPELLDSLSESIATFRSRNRTREVGASAGWPMDSGLRSSRP